MELLIKIIIARLCLNWVIEFLVSLLFLNFSIFILWLILIIELWSDFIKTIWGTLGLYTLGWIAPHSIQFFGFVHRVYILVYMFFSIRSLTLFINIIDNVVIHLIHANSWISLRLMSRHVDNFMLLCTWATRCASSFPGLFVGCFLIIIRGFSLIIFVLESSRFVSSCLRIFSLVFIRFAQYGSVLSWWIKTVSFALLILLLSLIIFVAGVAGHCMLLVRLCSCVADFAWQGLLVLHAILQSLHLSSRLFFKRSALI